MEQKHVSEALKEKKLAEGALKTSFFGNWKPDNDSAAHHYEKAGQYFKLGKSFAESKSCYIEAAKYYNAARVLFSAGKCHEAAGVCSKELGNFEEAHHHIERAGDYYTQNGTASSAVSCYTKGAEGLSVKLPERAAELYLRAGDLEKDNDHVREAIKCFLGAKKIFARNKMYKECITAVQLARQLYEQMEHYEHIRKCNMSLVILHLARGDSVAAKQSISGEVSLVADQLIDAVDNGDDETIKQLSSHGDIVYLDTEIAKIVKFLTQDGALNVPSAQRSKSSNSTPATSSIFKSSGQKSGLNSQKDELFSRPNKQNRDELFARTKPSSESDRKELFSRPAVTQPAAVCQSDIAHEPQSVTTTSGADTNPYETENSERSNVQGKTSTSNPFGEADDNNPFGEDDLEDLC